MQLPTSMIIYNGKWVEPRHLRVMLYNRDGQSCVSNDYDDYELKLKQGWRESRKAFEDAPKKAKKKGKKHANRS